MLVLNELSAIMVVAEGEQITSKEYGPKYLLTVIPSEAVTLRKNSYLFKAFESETPTSYDEDTSVG